jgi:lipopolysaccharide/colanic/teichoic acid biosynthesis glycosyltransferase
MKRTFDCVTAAIGVVLLSPLFLVVAALIKLDSRGPVFFRQPRIGRHFRPFRIYKFRTMVEDAELRGGAITSRGDPRVTTIGRLLRRTKIDELPQLINVLNGDMSLVGPRPEVARYVEMFHDDYRRILTVRPGITDLASMKYRHEAELLGCATDADKEYVGRILPDKIRLAREYVHRATFWFDVALVLRTLAAILRPASDPQAHRR